MTTVTESRPPRRLGRSILAVAGAIVVIFALSMAMDELMYALGVFPRPPKVSFETGAYLIGTAYRSIIGVIGGWLAGRIAPSRPMGHALTVGGIGVLLTTVGLVAALTMDLGPVWYPAALLVLTLPCAWLGGWLAQGGKA